MGFALQSLKVYIERPKSLIPYKEPASLAGSRISRVFRVLRVLRAFADQISLE